VNNVVIMATPQQRGLRRRVVDWFINTGWKRLAIWLIIIFLPIVVDVLYIYKFGPEMFTGFLIDVVTIAPFSYKRIVDVPILSIEVPGENVVRKPEFITYPSPCLCPAQQPQQTQQQVPAQLIGYLRL
jgi:hypothetical protein